MSEPKSSRRVGVLTAITSPLGFYVLSLLIVEATIGVVLVKSDLDATHKFYGLILAVCMFLLVVLVVTLLVWHKPENLTFDRDAHLIDRGKIPYGSDANEVKAADLDKQVAPKGKAHK